MKTYLEYLRNKKYQFFVYFLFNIVNYFMKKENVTAATKEVFKSKPQHIRSPFKGERHPSRTRGICFYELGSGRHGKKSRLSVSASCGN